MAETKNFDPLVSTDKIEVDAETAAAIERGIQDADAGRVVSADEVRKRIPEWISKFSTQSQP